MNFILSTLTSILVMMASLVITDDFIYLTIIYFVTFGTSYCWFWEKFFEVLKTTKKTASKG